MDDLYPKLSTYEFDYTTDINKKMRVPEKLSYDSDNSATLSEGHDVSFRNYPVADLSAKPNYTYFTVLDAKRSTEYALGYSPDLLKNSDIRSKIVCKCLKSSELDTNFIVYRPDTTTIERSRYSVNLAHEPASHCRDCVNNKTGHFVFSSIRLSSNA
ncbi:unnamed protein product [Schistosoma mattheei]|uniref:Uncharacterized protein n=1 Tax=Schistosoma mattheei TaxID=31246 RepID=A0A183Q3W8_9TREM|nr:unnamed protein product [Schistosoma mattheei]